MQLNRCIFGENPSFLRLRTTFYRLMEQDEYSFSHSRAVHSRDSFCNG